jgi:hypothetical protein
MAIFNKAPPWNPDHCTSVVLWHGCTDLDRQGIESKGISLSLSRPDLDFGQGFYTTTLQRQAQHWAVRRYDSKWVPKENNRPVALRFRVPRSTLAGLLSLTFVRGDYASDDYWSLVQHCRQSKAMNKKRHTPAKINDHRGPVSENGYNWYDVVSGPVVADWKQRATLEGMDQFSFHTAQGIELFNKLIGSRDSEDYSWQPVNA